MGEGRLEAFSDGVLAIIITIMLLELKALHEATLAALRPLGPAVGNRIDVRTRSFVDARLAALACGSASAPADDADHGGAQQAGSAPP